MTDAPAIETRGLTKRFGGLVAVDDLSLAVPPGQIRGLIGPNGSGKTTAVNVLSGLYRPDAGEIHLCGRRTDRLRPHEIAACGVARTFQISKLFGSMTVLENVLVPALAARDRGARRSSAAVLDRARGLLDFVTLDGMRHALAKELSGGQSMLVQIARALMVDPLHVILMDEPFAGVHPAIRDIIMEAILKMNREEAVTFLIVSHEMAELRRLCQRVSVMDDGHLIAEGTLEEMAHTPRCSRRISGRRRARDGAPRPRACRRGVRRGDRYPLGHHAAGRAGQHHGRDRTQWRGQVHAAPDDLRLPARAAGTIALDGRPIHTLAPHEVKRLGISYVPQGANIFPQLTVEENLLLGAWVIRRERVRVAERLERAYAAFPRLLERRRRRATALSGGEAKMLSLAKELVTDPALILVDEPSAGLAPRIVEQVYARLLEVRGQGVTILLVDQNINKAVEVSDYLYMIERGGVKREGPRAEFADQLRDIVRDSLLGA